MLDRAESVAAPPEAPEVPDPWRTWFATCSLVGLTDDQIVEIAAEKGIAREASVRELARLHRHPYVAAARRVGDRVRKLEALLDARRTVARASTPDSVIETRSSITERVFVDEYYSRNRPVIVDNVAEHWQARFWTPEGLAEQCGSALVEVMTHRSNHSASQVAQQMLLTSYVESITGADAAQDQYLVANNHFFSTPAGRARLPDLSPLPPFLRSDASGDAAFLWLGPAGSLTRLHYDVMNVFFVQLFGRKRFLLASPEQSPLVYNVEGVFSEVDPEEPDLDRYPAFAACQLHEVVLEPGHGLFLPVGWWHHVRSLDVSVSVSFTGFTVPNVFPAMSQVSSRQPD